QVELFRTLSEEDANRVYRELEHSGIEVKKTTTDKRKGLFGIEVPRSQASRALEILRARDVPRKTHRGFSLITDGGNLIPSPKKERIKYFIALSGELEQTLENLPGVQYARVHFAMPSEPGLILDDSRKTMPQRASVVLKVQEKLFQLSPKDVQVLIAGALPDIKPEAVSVVVQLAVSQKAGPAGYSSVGPYAVSPASRVPLFITLLVAVLLLVLFGVLLIMARITISRLRDEMEHGEESSSPRGTRE
ncbi:hypothetical protein KJ865_00095, partial [Myxococcota bacterium]|nr:hypothetical protein [Myxococcota bacterium]